MPQVSPAVLQKSLSRNVILNVAPSPCPLFHPVHFLARRLVSESKQTKSKGNQFCYICLWVGGVQQLFCSSLSTTVSFYIQQ